MNINMIFDCKNTAYFTRREVAAALFKYHFDVY